MECKLKVMGYGMPVVVHQVKSLILSFEGLLYLSNNINLKESKANRLGKVASVFGCSQCGGTRCGIGRFGLRVQDSCLHTLTALKPAAFQLLTGCATGLIDQWFTCHSKQEKADEIHVARALSNHVSIMVLQNSSFKQTQEECTKPMTCLAQVMRDVIYYSLLLDPWDMLEKYRSPPWRYDPKDGEGFPQFGRELPPRILGALFVLLGKRKQKNRRVRKPAHVVRRLGT